MHFSSIILSPFLLLTMLPACSVEFTTQLASETTGSAEVDGPGGTSGQADGSDGTGDEGAMEGATACNQDADCAAFVDFADPCFSVSCQAPLPFNIENAEKNACLASWDSYQAGKTRPEACTVETEEATDCPAVCTLEPVCLTASCTNGTCAVNQITDTKLCPESIAACVQTKDILKIKIDEARACTPDNSGTNACASPGWVLDECSCPAPTQRASGAAYQAALDASEAFSENCLPAQNCPPCTIVPAEAVVTCRSNPLMPDVSICESAD